MLPATCAIIVALSAAQRFGAGRDAGLFGPITLVWFLAKAADGLAHIAAGASACFPIPASRVIEIGPRIAI